ncbi:MAG: hypothetical protein CENE_00004 [Candidatus Celerinatantimonas neptuna]|nr:MAG: hypothetical protein CENE_00004 [Candidatus Celerinatantimonas neptuna]
MSIKLMTQVWDASTFKGNTKLVMLCLADFANDEGLCWPSIATIAKKCSVSSSTVKAQIRDLIRAGFLKVQQRLKRTDEGKVTNDSNLYQIIVSALKQAVETGGEFQPGSKSNRGQNTTVPGADSGYKPSLDPSENNYINNPIVPSLLNELNHLLSGQFDSDDAKPLQNAIADSLRSSGWVVELEHQVADRGDGRCGCVDLLASKDSQKIAMEIDRKSPRKKSLVKLSQVDAFPIVALRLTPNQAAQVTCSDALVIGTLHAEQTPTAPKKLHSATSFPADFALTESMREWYGNQAEFTIPIETATDMWTDAMRAKGFKYVDWASAWRNGMRKQNQWAGQGYQGSGTQRSNLNKLPKIGDYEIPEEYR